MTMSTHPLHTLGFEAVPSLAELGFEPQLPVGAQEPVSGRKIVQPTRSPAINQSLASEAMAAYKARLAEVIRQIPGATLVASRDAKNPRRLREKIQQEGQPAAPEVGAVLSGRGQLQLITLKKSAIGPGS